MTSDQRHRLRWRCRRGMRELDMVFAAFLTQRYDDAPSDQRAAFEHLIETEDADVYAWLMGYAEVPDPALADIVDQMRRLLSEHNKR